MTKYEEYMAIVVLMLCTMVLRRRILRRRQGRPRRLWARAWLQRRSSRGCFNTLVSELTNEDLNEYRNYMRMGKDTFDTLLQKVKPIIERQDTNMRQCIPADERLAVTLRFMATGESYSSLQYQFRIPKCTLSIIIPETCGAIYQALKDEYLKVPQTTEEWLEKANEFIEKWNFDHCIGAIDGKHVVIQPPNDSGSQYFNYKHTFSIVLMALVDADYKFTYVDVGCNGRISDGGVFKNSSLSDALEQKSLSIPAPEPLPGRTVPCPYVIVADDAFPLKPHLMKPHNTKELDLEKRIFDYRLSRARRIVENAFGILANRFRVFLSPIALSTEKVEKLTLAAVCLHNMLREMQGLEYMPAGSVDLEDTNTKTVVLGDWRTKMPNGNFMSVNQQGSNRYSLNAKDVRDEFTEYFNTNGQVEWQWGMI